MRCRAWTAAWRSASSLTNFASALNVVRLLAADAGQRDHRRPADRPAPATRRRPSNVGLHRRGRVASSCSKTTLAVARRAPEREAVRAACRGRRRCGCRSTIDSIGNSRAEIDLPPRVRRALLRCASGRRRRKLPLVLPSMARLGVAAVGGVLLRGLALAGDVAAVADRPRPRPASASAACPAARCGRSGPCTPCPSAAGVASSGGRPSSSGSTFG